MSSWDKIVAILGAIHHKAKESGLEDVAVNHIKDLAAKGLQELEVNLDSAVEQGKALLAGAEVK